MSDRMDAVLASIGTDPACPECVHPIEKHHATGGCWHTDHRNDNGLNIYCLCRRRPDGSHYPVGMFTKEKNT